MRALIALHLLVALALILVMLGSFGVITLPISCSSSPPVIGPQPNPPHNRFRAANTLTLNENIAWEINLGGSGEETIHSFFQSSAGHLFVVGTTTSTDYDFEENTLVTAESPVATFVIRVGRDGRPQHYAFVEGSIVDKVIHGIDTLFLFQRHHGENLTRVHTLSLSTLNETAEPRVLDTSPLVDATILKINYITHTPIGVPHYFRIFLRSQDALGRVFFASMHFNTNFTPRAGLGSFVELPHSMSQTLVDIICFGHSGFFVLSNVSDDMRRNAVGHYWSNLDGRTSRDLELGGAIQNRRYQARGVTISRHNNRFAILGTLDTAPTQTHIFEFNFDLVHQVTHAESMSGLATGVLPTHNGYLISTQGASSFPTYFLDYRFSDKRLLTSLENFSNVGAMMDIGTGDDIMVTGMQNNRPSLGIARGGNFANFSSVSIGSSTERIIDVRNDGLNPRYAFVILESRGESADVSNNFGSSDVWLVRVRI